MKILNFFKPVETWSVEQVREFLREHMAADYNLIDVRQPAEFERGHIPGAQLIPLGELSSRLTEIESKKPTICY